MNLEEVAKRAKVSTATVSRVLNNVGPVKISTRARVLRAAEELRYHPNLHARNLAGGKSRTIGMIVSNLENPFFLDIYRAAEADALADGYEILLASTNYQPEHLVKSIRLMIGLRVAGLALIVSEMDYSLIDELAERGTPVVFYDVGTPKRNISNVLVNYAKGIERVVTYLHDLGHERMAFISHHSSLGPLSIRERAFRETVSRYSPAIKWKVVANVDSIDGGREAAQEVLKSGFAPTAIICTNDFMALSVMHQIRESGFRVPEEVSVTGFDNIQLGEICSPPLTTLHIPRARIGQLISRMLREAQGTGGFEGQEIVIDPELVIRGSSGPARVN